MPVLAFTGQSGRDADNEFANSSRLINCYLEPLEGRVVLKTVLGAETLANLSDVFVRSLHALGDEIYAVCNTSLYRITESGSVENVGTVAAGNTSMSRNTGILTIASGGTYYTWTNSTSTLVAPTGAAFSDVGSVTFLGQYTVISEEDGRRFAWSAIADPATFSGLDFATAESRDDNILRVMALNGNLVIFKEESREVWYQTGSADSTEAFQRLAGGVFDTGLRSYYLVAEMDHSAFFVGDDDIAYVTDGVQQRPVSNRAVETAIAQGEPYRCVYYEDEGHKMACIIFTDRPAWCYDLATDKWHERTNDDVWNVVATERLNRKWYSATQSGVISKMIRNNNDNGVTLVREAVSNTLYQDGELFTIAELELFARVGRYELRREETPTLSEGSAFFVDADGDGFAIPGTSVASYPAQCSIQMSKDNGMTWGKEKFKSLGQIGDYDARINWRALGQYRQATARLIWSEDGEISFRNEARVRLA